MDIGGHHVHSFTLAPGGFGHVAKEAGRTVRGAEDLAGVRADVVDQAADGAEELVEPAGQICGLVLTSHFEIASQIAFTLSNSFQTTGCYGADWGRDQPSETGTDHGKDQSHDNCNGRGDPSWAISVSDHLAHTNQADDWP
ncbi:hypothetical protein [Pantoea sp. Ap-967]|uniref:hypothetical protein n=1 Tax=Pantoea sp. Ap-967 TaxID=2608362 RepID=UPI001963C0A3|nr:hypothetical protein [Pantoea sp. Ap-967]